MTDIPGLYQIHPRDAAARIDAARANARHARGMREFRDWCMATANAAHNRALAYAQDYLAANPDPTTGDPA